MKITLNLLFASGLLFGLSWELHQKTISEMELNSRVLHEEVMGLRGVCGKEAQEKIMYAAGYKAARNH